ncbi:MAG: TIGR02757 family protein [Acidobacteriota bacterium]|nr:TIGR02757 family protein [Acidobacteriota bacterium]
MLKAALDRAYAAFNASDAALDPIQVVRRYRDPRDFEIAGFCAAALAFGRVSSVIQSVERLLAVMGPSPAAYVARFDPARQRGELAALGHRWTRSVDLVALLWVLRQMLEEAGSIEAFFLRGLDPAATDIEAALDDFSVRALALDLRAAYGTVPRRPGVGYFFTRPASGSGCKRLNLFLRWMVRRDAVDAGPWRGVRPAQLVIPLDTHVIRLGQCLRLTHYQSPGWRMAQEITAALRALDPVDPVRYDFALCHLGMMNACGFRRPQGDAQCPLRGACRPRGRRRRPSARPSARR